jgi:hypothetical protein
LLGDSRQQQLLSDLIDRQLDEVGLVSWSALLTASEQWARVNATVIRAEVSPEQDERRLTRRV